MAAEFFVQNQFNLVDFYHLWFGGVRNCNSDGELAKLAGCNKKSGGGASLRIVRILLKVKPSLKK